MIAAIGRVITMPLAALGDFPVRFLGSEAFDVIGAGEAIRTPDPNLGKVMLYP